MRKVTASAVILTALTGCSQSNVPSTQWSFEVPNGNEAVGVQRITDSDTRTSFASEISANALSGSLQTSTGAMMGPAFEQPTSSADSTTSSPPSTSPDLFANGNFSALVTTATNPKSNAFIQATARPDPIAQARSYLSRSYRPTSVISRVPYTSQVYLPTTPAAAPLSALGSVPAAPIAAPVTAPAAAPTRSVFQPAGGSSVSASAVQRPAQNPLQSPTAAWTTASSTTALPVPSAATSTNVSASVSTSSASSSDVYRPETIPSLYQTVDASDDLPVLRPNENLVARTPAAPAAPSEVAVDSDVPIGTSILRELQQSSSGSELAEQSVEQPVAQPTFTQPIASQPIAVQSVDAEPAAAQSVESQSVESQPVAIQFVEAQSSEGPTLARLLAGLQPQRQSPAINSFRPPVNELSVQEVTDSQTIRYENSDAEIAQPSPLLSGLQSDEPIASTIYVPIPDETTADTSASFIQAAIAALGQEVSEISTLTEGFATEERLSAEDGEILLEMVEAIQSDDNLVDSEQQEAERVARLLSLIRGVNRVPSLVQEADVIPVEASREDNIQANVVNFVRAAQQNKAAVAASPMKPSVRKYRQRIYWNNATI